MDLVMEESSAIDILLVDDNKEDAEMTIRTLRKGNMAERLLHLSDGEEALTYFSRYSNNENLLPKVILLDLNMPKVNGLEVLRTIRGDDKLKSLPVIVMTSSKEDSDIIETYSLGVNAYIVKPLDARKFVEIVADLDIHWMIMNSEPKH